MAAERRLQCTKRASGRRGCVDTGRQAAARLGQRETIAGILGAADRIGRGRCNAVVHRQRHAAIESGQLLMVLLLLVLVVVAQQLLGLRHGALWLSGVHAADAAVHRRAFGQAMIEAAAAGRRTLTAEWHETDWNGIITRGIIVSKSIIYIVQKSNKGSSNFQ